ncbi:endonuclease/exonuclease/phosphatase family protein [Francisellaceae bacterium]|nr:endonuclease/exonuclease/phosphatase family protein [Francisellaceae bacterium]
MYHFNKKLLTSSLLALLYANTLSADNIDGKINAMTFNVRVCIDSGSKSCEARKPFIEDIINANINEGKFTQNINTMDFIGFQESDILWRNLSFESNIQKCEYYKNINQINGCINFGEGLTLVYNPKRWQLENTQRKTLALDDDCRWSSNRDEVCQTGNRMIGMAYFREKETNQFIYIIDTHGPRAVKWERWNEFNNLLQDRVNKDAPIIVLGDFNRRDPLQYYDEFIKVNTDPAGSHGFSNHWEVGTIDYIYYTEGLNKIDDEVIRYPSKWSGDVSHGFASDHYPVWASFTFENDQYSHLECKPEINVLDQIRQGSDKNISISWNLITQNEYNPVSHYQILNWLKKPIEVESNEYKISAKDNLLFNDSPEGSSEYHYYIRSQCMNGKYSDSDVIVVNAYEPDQSETCGHPAELINANISPDRKVTLEWEENGSTNLKGYVVMNYNLGKSWSQSQQRWVNISNNPEYTTSTIFSEEGVGIDNLDYKGPFVYYVGSVCTNQEFTPNKENLLKATVEINSENIHPNFTITKGYWPNNSSHRFTIKHQNTIDDSLHYQPITSGQFNTFEIYDEDNQLSCNIIDMANNDKKGDCGGVVISEDSYNNYKIYLQPQLF